MDKKIRKIILDTNFLLIPWQFKLDIFSELERICVFKYDVFIVDKTIDELSYIFNNQKGKNKDAAKLALKIINLKKIKKINTDKEKNVDNLILDIVDKDYIVATQDKELKKLLKEKNIPVIVLRQKQKLELQGKI